MTAETTRPRIATLNERVGSKQIPEDVGGAWIVYAPAGHVTCVADNRDAAETAIYCKAEESGLNPQDFRIEVWEIQRFYEDDPDRVQKVLDWVGRGYGSRAWGAEQLNISEWELSETYGDQIDKMRFLS